MEKYEREAKEKNRESWYLSWALDTNEEERDKGTWTIPMTTLIIDEVPAYSVFKQGPFHELCLIEAVKKNVVC